MVVVGAVLVALHFVLHVGLGFEAGAPDLATLGVLVLARELRMGTAAGIGFAVGLLEDATNPLGFGSATMAFTLVGAAGARSRDLFVGDSVTFVVTYLFAGKFIRDGIQWFMASSELREPFQRAMLVDSVVASLYLAVVGVVLVRVFGNWLETGGAA